MSDSQVLGREDLLDRLSVILSRPAYAGNVGAVARVMANFGVRHGMIVSPRCDVNSVEARQFATGQGAVILATMRHVKKLDECVEGAHAVIGVTRRTGQLRKPSLSLADIAGRLIAGRVHLVFGPEESGLTDEDLRQCSDILTLDVADSMPSINLSHAVAVVLSRLFEMTLAATRTPAPTAVGAPIMAEDLLRLSERLEGALRRHEAAGTIVNADRMSRILAQSLNRAGLDDAELATWHGLITLLGRE